LYLIIEPSGETHVATYLPSFPLLSVVREYRVEPPGENDATLLALPCSKIKTYWWVPATMSSWIKEDALVVAVGHAELRPPKVLKQRRNK